MHARPQPSRRPGFRASRFLRPALVLLALALPAGLPVAALAQPAEVPTPKAYAPERIWELPVNDQRRVIDLEYRERSGGRTIPEDQMRFYLDQIRFSRWTFSQVKADIADSLGGQGISDPGVAGTLRCESEDGRERTCPTPWPGLSRLVRQLSSTACVQNRNWSSSRGQIWVGAGCRGEFAAVEESTPAGEVRCESSDNRQRSCPTPWYGESRLVRQLSGTPCVAGQNWWSEQGRVLVSGGCRATFAAAFGAGQGQEIRCESGDGRYRECGNGLYGTPVLVRQLSDTACTLGRNFGLRDGRLWVDRGCRGVFRIQSGAQDGYTITCASDRGQYRTCAWDRNRGIPRLIRTLSDSPCVQGQSWGYERRGEIWVNAGCRAVFGTR